MHPTEVSHPVSFSPNIQPTYLFFNALFGNHLKDNASFIALSWQAPAEKRFHNEYYADTYLATARAADLREKKVDSFFAVAPVVRPSRKKKAIRGVLTLHMDVDGADKATERKLRQLKPTAIVRSGGDGCFHPYFFLDSSVRLPENLRLVEELNKRLALEIGVSPGSTFDASRILRVPGTFNLKNPKKPRPVELIEFQPAIRYPLEYFVERFKVDPYECKYQLEKPLTEEVTGERGHYLNHEDRIYLDRLLRYGLFEPHSRNYSMKLIIRSCYEQGLGKGETESITANFFVNHHNNLSKDWLKDPERCLKYIRYAVENWWRKAYSRRRPKPSQAQLSYEDQERIQKLPLGDSDKKFVYNALTHILRNKQGDLIYLSARQLQKLPGVHSRNWKQKIVLLQRLGFLRLKREAKGKDRLAAEYEVLFNFSRELTEKPAVEFKTLKERIVELLLSGAGTSDIRSRIPEASRQLIFHHAKRLAQTAQDHQLLDA